MPSAAAPLADRLVEARRAGSLVLDPPVPADVDEALALQDAVARALGQPLGGWKVAMPPAGPVAAPIFAPDVKAAPTVWRRSDWLAIEVEVAFRLKRDFDPAGGVTAEAAEALLGVEMVRSRLADGPRSPFTAFLADNLGNDGYVLGPTLVGAPDAVLGRRCRVTLDGEVLHDAPAAHPQGDVVAPLLANAGNRRLGGFRTGQFVTTGSLCGLVIVPRPGRLVCEVEGLGSIEIGITP